MNNPLNDFDFLRELDNYRNKTVFARITSLTKDLYPVERIEGEVTAGTINIDGKSAVTRICNLTISTNDFNLNNFYWSLSTQIKIEIGISNKFNNILTHKYYQKYDDIIWFQQGIFILTSFKVNLQLKKYNITIQGKDKMCLLNGDLGGSFNSKTAFDSIKTENDDGSWTEEKVPISILIKDMIHHYTQENPYNIIIKDIDEFSRRVLYNNTRNIFYLLKNVNTGDIQKVFYIGKNYDEIYYYSDNSSLIVNFNNIISSFIFDIITDDNNTNISITINNETPSKIFTLIDDKIQEYTIIKVEPGEDLGYELIETYYPDELVANPGDTITSILDKIVKTFGNYEYFYNLQGQFVFQAKETYVNTSWNNIAKYTDEQYIEPQQISSKVKYAFESNRLITAYQNTPNLNKIKNDFTIWGVSKTNDNETEIPIHMRYAIDTKPMYYHSITNNIIYISDKFYNNYLKKKVLLNNELKDFESITYNNKIYQLVDWREIIYQMQEDYYKYWEDENFLRQIQLNNIDLDFGIHLYEQGKTGYEQYYHDIEGFWRLLYAPETYFDDLIKRVSINSYYAFYKNKSNFFDQNKYIGPWNKNIKTNPELLTFWIDFFEPENRGIGQFAISAIGDRAINKENDNVRALIYKNVPNVIFINELKKEEYEQKGILPIDKYSFIINDDFINNSIENGKILTSRRGLTAQSELDQLIYEQAYCQETISITSLPIYYLLPNTIISVKDETHMINGYYIINKISLPLQQKKGTMKITAIKVPQRIY